MGVSSKVLQIIAQACERRGVINSTSVANDIAVALEEKRYMIRAMKGSPEMLRRLHAHCRYLGDATGRGYEYYRDMAYRHAVDMHRWPTVVIPVDVTLDNGSVVTVDVTMPDSSTKATNAQLMEAYSVIADEARRAGEQLPEEV